MFATLRCGSDDESLVFINQTDRLPPQGQGHQHSACYQCRDKKLRCTGQRDRCDRCKAQQLQCRYSEKCKPLANDGSGERRRRTVQSQGRPRSATTLKQKTSTARGSTSKTVKLPSPPNSRADTPSSHIQPHRETDSRSPNNAVEGSDSGAADNGYELPEGGNVDYMNIAAPTDSSTIHALYPKVSFGDENPVVCMSLDDDLLSPIPDMSDQAWMGETTTTCSATDLNDFTFSEMTTISPVAAQGGFPMQRSSHKLQRLPDLSSLTTDAALLAETSSTSHKTTELTWSTMSGDQMSPSMCASDRLSNPKTSSLYAASSRTSVSSSSTCDCTQVALQLLEKSQVQTHQKPPLSFSQPPATSATPCGDTTQQKKHSFTKHSYLQRRLASGCDAAQLQVFKRAVLSLRRVASCERCLESSSFVMLLTMICERLTTTSSKLATAFKKIIAQATCDSDSRVALGGGSRSGALKKSTNTISSCSSSSSGSGRSRQGSEDPSRDVGMAEVEGGGSSDEEYIIDSDEELGCLIVTLALVQMKSLRLLIGELANHCREKGMKTHLHTLVQTEGKLMSCESDLRLECLGS